jgi:IS30 family transposase
MLQVSKFSISRKIERNSVGGKYDADEAQKRYNYKKQKSDFPPEAAFLYAKY